MIRYSKADLLMFEASQNRMSKFTPLDKLPVPITGASLKGFPVSMHLVFLVLLHVFPALAYKSVRVSVARLTP